MSLYSTTELPWICIYVRVSIWQDNVGMCGGSPLEQNTSLVSAQTVVPETDDRSRSHSCSNK